MTSKLEDFVKLPNGGTLYLLPLQEAELQQIALRVKADFEARGEPINPPTYKTEADETFVWDAASVLADGTEEDKQAFLEYTNAATRLLTAQEKQAIYYVFTEGTSRYVSPAGKEILLAVDPVDDVWEPPTGWLARRLAQGYVRPANAY